MRLYYGKSYSGPSCRDKTKYRVYPLKMIEEDVGGITLDLVHRLS